MCSKCNRELSVEMFNKNKRHKDGFSRWCRECVKQYYRYNRDNKEKILEARKANRERLKKELAKRLWNILSV